MTGLFFEMGDPRSAGAIENPDDAFDIGGAQSLNCHNAGVFGVPQQTEAMCKRALSSREESEGGKAAPTCKPGSVSAGGGW